MRQTTLVVCAALWGCAGLPAAQGSVELGEYLLLDEPEMTHLLSGADDSSEWAQMVQAHKSLSGAKGVILHAEPRLFAVKRTAEMHIGMAATTSLHGGEVIMRIPARLLLHGANAALLKELPANVLAGARERGFNTTDLLKLFLFDRQRHAETAWGNYLNHALKPSPLGRLEADRRYVPYAGRVLALVETEKKERLARRYGLSHKDAWGAPAHAFVDKHVRQMHGLEGGATEAAVPGLSLFTNRPGQTAWGYSAKDSAVILYSLGPVARGEQVFVDGVGRSALGMTMEWEAGITRRLAHAVVEGTKAEYFYHTPETEIDFAFPPLVFKYRMTEPPTELILSARMPAKQQVEAGAYSVTDAEGISIRTASDYALEALNVTKMEELFLHLCTTTLPIREREHVATQYAGHHVRRYNDVVLNVLADYVEDISDFDYARFGHVSALRAQQRRPTVRDDFLSAAFGMAYLALRIHKTNVLRTHRGMREMVLPRTSLARLFNSSVLDDLGGVTFLRDAGILQQALPSSLPLVYAQVRALRRDAIVLLSRAVLRREHFLADQILQLGPGVVSANGFMASCNETRTRGLVGLRLLHVAVADEDLRMVELLVQHGANYKLKSMQGASAFIAKVWTQLTRRFANRRSKITHTRTHRKHPYQTRCALTRLRRLCPWIS